MLLGLEGQISTEKLNTEKTKTKIRKQVPLSMANCKGAHAQGETEEARSAVERFTVVQQRHCFSILSAAT